MAADGPDWLPVWDRKLATALEPIAPIVDLFLIGIIMVTLWAIIRWRTPAKLLWLAFLISP